MPNSIRPLAFVLALLALVAPAAAAEKLKLLIVDGQNNHNWQAMTPPVAGLVSSSHSVASGERHAPPT